MKRNPCAFSFSVCAAVIALGGVSEAASAEPEKEKEIRQRPLAGLPSKPGPHIDKIEALGDNQWLNLGPPTADPRWGKARGRSWSSNMPFAPDVRGAFVFGEGVHAHVKPDGRYMNDLWFYDVNVHRWICLYPGIEVKTVARRIKDKELTLNENGLLVEKDGQPLPPLLIHAYGYLGYDPDRRRFAFFGSQFGNYFTTGKGGVFEEANKLFQEQRKGKKFPSLSPFFCDPAAGQFECFPVDLAPGGQPYGANLLVCVRSKKQFVYGGSDGVWFLDVTKRTWVDARPKGTPPAGIDRCAACDAKRDRICHHGKGGKAAEDNFLVYDVKANAWSRPRPKGTGPAYSSCRRAGRGRAQANCEPLWPASACFPARESRRASRLPAARIGLAGLRRMFAAPVVEIGLAQAGDEPAAGVVLERLEEREMGLERLFLVLMLAVAEEAAGETGEGHALADGGGTSASPRRTFWSFSLDAETVLQRRTCLRPMLVQQHFFDSRHQMLDAAGMKKSSVQGRANWDVSRAQSCPLPKYGGS